MRPRRRTCFFGDRGSQFFPGVALFDTSINYDIPLYKSARPWLKFDVYNLLNDLKVIRYDTTVNPDPNSPLDAMGLPTGLHQGIAVRSGDVNGGVSGGVPGPARRPHVPRLVRLPVLISISGSDFHPRGSHRGPSAVIA